jgi:hypothetical protein
LSGDRFDHVGASEDKSPFLLTAHGVLRTPTWAAHGGFMSTLDDFLCELRMALSRFANHVPGYLHAVPIRQIQHRRDTLPVALGEPSIGGRV